MRVITMYGAPCSSRVLLDVLLDVRRVPGLGSLNPSDVAVWQVVFASFPILLSKHNIVLDILNLCIVRNQGHTSV